MNKQELKDEVLFDLYRKGDTQAFDILLKRHKASLFGMIMRSVRNTEKAEDIFQEVFFKIVEKRDQFRDAVSFKAWIFTICRTTCIDAARKVARTPRHESIHGDDESPGHENRLKAKEPNALDVVSDLSSQGFYEKILEELPSEQKETFEFKVYDDLTFEEIGTLMNCSPNTAKSRMRYALDYLRDVFNKRGLLVNDTRKTGE